jgi:hypothetical protein
MKHEAMPRTFTRPMAADQAENTGSAKNQTERISRNHRSKVKIFGVGLHRPPNLLLSIPA